MVLVSDKLSNAIGILQTKLRYRERHEARRVGLEPMPLDEHIEGGHGERQPRLKIRPAPVHDLLEVADHGQHREHRLHQHAVLPLTALTQFEVGGIALGGMKTGVAQDNHLLFELPNEPLKGIVRHIGCVTCPTHDQPPLIEQQTEFAADDPAVIRHAFAADLLRTAAFADGVNELNAIGIDHPQHRWGGQEGLRPVVMGPQEAKEAGALGEVGKQRPIIPRQPAIEGPVAPALEGMQEPQGHHFTGPETGLGVFGDVGYLVRDLAKYGRDKLDGGGHRRLRSWQGGTLATSLEEMRDHDNKADKYYWVHWSVSD